jgi:hypothetical protein
VHLVERRIQGVLKILKHHSFPTLEERWGHKARNGRRPPSAKRR